MARRNRTRSRGAADKSRRGFLLKIGTGAIAAGALFAGLESTGAFNTINSVRSSNVEAAADSDGLLGLSGFNPSTTYQSPHKVTVTNNTSTDLTGTNNSVSSANGRLEFRDVGSTNSQSSLDLGSLNQGDSRSFEIVTASGESGDVSDVVTISYDEPNAISIDVRRNITIRFKSSGRLVYAMNSDIRTYDAVQDKEFDPPELDNDATDIIGANSVDFTGGSNADIAFVSKSKVGGKGNRGRVYRTELDGTVTALGGPGNQSHKILRKKTRLAVAKVYGNIISTGGGFTEGEYCVLYANKNKSKIFAIDADGNIQEVISSGNGAGGVSGLADIDNDGEPEMVFIDSSQQLRYIDQDGTEIKIQNGGVGSNNSAGFGPPGNFDNFSLLQIPFVDGSQYPSLVDYQGNKTILKASDIAKKAAVAPVDVDNDGDLEFVFIGSGDPYNGRIGYIDDVGGSNTDKILEIGTGINGGTDVTRKPDEKVALNSGNKPDTGLDDA